MNQIEALNELVQQAEISALEVGVSLDMRQSSLYRPRDRKIEAELQGKIKYIQEAIDIGRTMILELETSEISKRDSEFREKYCRDPEFSAVVDMLASNVINDRISMEDLKGAIKLVEINVIGYGEMKRG